MLCLTRANILQTVGFTLHADAKHLDDIVAEHEFSRFVDFFHSKVLISIVVAE